MKHYYLIALDTETTRRNTVADFGAVLVTRKGEIVAAIRRDGFGRIPAPKHPLYSLTLPPSDSRFLVRAICQAPR